MLSHFLDLVFWFEIDIMRLNGSDSALCVNNLPKLKFIVTSSCEDKLSHNFNVCDRTCMSKLLFYHFPLCPVPKHQVTIITTKYQNLIIQFFHLKNRIISFKCFASLLFLKVLQRPYFNCGIPWRRNQIFIVFHKYNLRYLRFMSFTRN